MKLFLTSFAVVTLDLVIPLLTKPPQQSKVAFISTAGNPYQDTNFVNLDKNKLLEMGFAVQEMDVAVTQGKELEQALSEVDILFVAGGNTFYLLDQARKSGFDRLVKAFLARGGLYIGSSAGSVLCCPTIEHVKVFDDPSQAPDLKDYAGLDLVPQLIIPHTQKEKYFERIKATKAAMEAKGFVVLELTDNEVLVVTDEKSEVLTITSNASTYV